MIIMKQRIKSFIKKIFMMTGLQIARYPQPDIQRRMRLVETHNINLILDVGANIGQYSNNMRIFGFEGKIISFEPLSSAFSIMSKLYANSSNRIFNNFALGESNSKSVINISGNSVSSSILKIEQKLLNLYPETKYIDSEEIEIKTLDSIFDTYCSEKDSIMLKIDTQGYEKNVILGAKNSLDKIKLIQMEMSMQNLYSDELMYLDMINFMDDNGFKLVSLEEGFHDPNTGYLLEFDAIFVNKKYELI